MCGIAGIVGSYMADQETLLRSLTRLLSHRGPDDEGIWHSQEASPGHRCMSILDLPSAGRQPMMTPDQRYRIVFNGEIYNYLELRQMLCSFGYRFQTQTDTEVL